jgi:outer membrane protein assembly factor BamB
MPSRRAVLAGGATGFAALVGGLFSIDGRQVGSSPYDWPMPRYDAAGTSHHPDAAGPKTEPTVRWVASVEPHRLGYPAWVQRPVRRGSTLYVPGDGLTAVDADSGTVRFRVGTGSLPSPVVVPTPRYERPALVAGNRNGLAGYNVGGGPRLFGRARGAKRWQYGQPQFERPDELQQLGGFSRPGGVPSNRQQFRPVSFDGTVYALVDVGDVIDLCAINPNDGTARWCRTLGPTGEELFVPSFRPVIRGETLYAVDPLATVAAISLDGDTERWRQSLDVADPAPPTATAAGLLLTYQEGAAMFGPGGTVRWQRTLDGPHQARTTAAVADGAAVFVAKGRLYALALDDGSTQWSAEEYTTPPAIADGVVYAPTPSGLTALDLDDGTVLFEYESAADLSTPVVGDGRLYCCRSDDQVIALQP